MKLPPCVIIRGTRNGGRYWFYRKVDGKKEWHKLTWVDEGESALYLAISNVKDERPNGFDFVFTHYLASARFEQLAAATRREYTRIVNNQLRGEFGSMHPHDLTPGLVAEYLEYREGEGAPVAGNRERAVLSSVCTFAMRKGWMQFNPCVGVRRNTERPRERFVSDAELAEALDKASPEFRDFLEAAYLTGLRQKDLRELTRENVNREGLVLQTSKDGKRLVIAWSPDLRAVIDRASKRHLFNPHVFTHSRGEAWKLWGVQSAMRKLNVPWTFHDLRAKAESDHEKGLGLLSRYQRAKKLTPVK